MWGQKQNKASSSVSNSGRHSVEQLSSEGESKNESSLCDSSRTDSGFLSSSNILSLEIRPPSPPKPTSKSDDRDSKTDSKYQRLDSGVDVGLSEQLSELCIEEERVDIRSSVSELDVRTTLSGLDIKYEEETEKEPTPQKESSLTSWSSFFKQDDEGDTVFQIAVLHEDLVRVVYDVISQIPNSSYLDIPNDMRQTALHLAVLSGQSHLVRRLVVAGANTSYRDNHGNTPLHLATSLGDVTSVTALTEPVSEQEVKEARLTYLPPYRSTPPPEVNTYNYEGLTCVHMAAQSQNVELLKHLVTYGANIDAREMKSGMTPLHIACLLGSESLVVFLMRELRADPDVFNYAYKTPYSLMKRDRRSSLMKALRSLGADTEESESESEEEDEEDDLLVSKMMGLRYSNLVDATA